jgi:hypothetical protein
MSERLHGATRLFPIIGDPIKYVDSPARLTRTGAHKLWTALLDAGVGEFVIHDVGESRAATLLGLLKRSDQGRVSAGPPKPRETAWRTSCC